MFFDRKEAGIKLSKALEKYKNRNVLVLAIPRGGTRVGYHLAKALNADLEVLVSKKLGYPFNPDAAFGAVSEEGALKVFPFAKKELPEKIIAQIITEKEKETQRQAQKLRNKKPLPGLAGRTVILVDDGIATGATILAAVKLCRKKGTEKIIIATPVGGREVTKKLKNEADEIVVLETPKQFLGVSKGYAHFHTMTDDEVQQIMETWQKERGIIHQKQKTKKVG